MSDDHIAIVAQMAAALCGRGGAQGAKARRRVAKRAWALYEEVRQARPDAPDKMNGGSGAEASWSEPATADA